MYLVIVNKEKCNVLHRGQSNTLHQCRLGTEWMGSNSAGKPLRVLVDSKPDMSPTWVRRANSILGCENRIVATRSR